MTKFKEGDFVKWNNGKHYTNDKRIDVVTSVIKDVCGNTQYMTKETNNNKEETPKQGKAYECYLVKA